MITKEEHIKWCKERANREIDFYKDPKQGLISMMSDLEKHPETRNHSGIKIAALMLFSGQIRTVEEAKKFIDGFR